MGRPVILRRCDQTWRELLRLVTSAFARSVDSMHVWGGIEAIALDRGRAAITEVLTRASGDAPFVILPSFCCPAVAEAVLAAGKRPRFVDIGADLNLDPAAVARRNDGDVAAIVVPHMFAKAAAIQEIQAEAGDTLVLDDAASAAGIRHEGRWLGTFGDAGMFSFAQQKSLVVGQGGLLLCNSDRVRTAMEGLWLGRPNPWTVLGEAAWWQWEYRWRHRLPTLRYHLKRSEQKLFGKRGLRPSGSRRLPGVYAAILRVQIDRMETILKRREANCAGLHARLSGLAGLEVPQFFEGCRLTRFMLRVPGARWELGRNPHPHPLAEFLAARGIDCMRPYQPLHLLDRLGEFADERLERTEETVPELAALPVQGKMVEADYDSIAEAVAEFLGSR